MNWKLRTLLGVIGINVLGDKQMSNAFIIKIIPLTYMLHKPHALRFCRDGSTLPAGAPVTKTHIHMMAIRVGSLEFNNNGKLVRPRGHGTAYQMASELVSSSC